MKVLEIGPRRTPKAHLIPGWEEAEVLTMDVVAENEPDIVCDAREIPEELHEQFDGVLASHVLEHFGWWLGDNILVEWTKLLKSGGEMHIIVPSAEWAGRQLLAEDPSPGVLAHLYGGNDGEFDRHKTMYTMRLLRQHFSSAGLEARNANTGQYNIGVKNVGYVAAQHYVMGVKP